jgi:methionyl-tRNA synthetase
VNSDLVGKVVNIASRCAGFIHKQFEGKLADSCAEPELLAQFVDAGAALPNITNVVILAKLCVKSWP